MEPIIFLYLMANALSQVPMQNIYYDKFSAMYNGTVNREEKTEKSTNEFIRNTTLTYAGISAIVIFLFGPLSDKYGRKFGCVCFKSSHTGRTSAYMSSHSLLP